MDRMKNTCGSKKGGQTPFPPLLGSPPRTYFLIKHGIGGK